MPLSPVIFTGIGLLTSGIQTLYQPTSTHFPAMSWERQ